eukprot:8425257-Karenia_brevis.AAC.1
MQQAPGISHVPSFSSEDEESCPEQVGREGPEILDPKARMNNALETLADQGPINALLTEANQYTDSDDRPWPRLTEWAHKRNSDSYGWCCICGHKGLLETPCPGVSGGRLK